MRQNWFRVGCVLLVAFGTLAFSTSVAAAAEASKAVVVRTNVGPLPIVTPTA